MFNLQDPFFRPLWLRLLIVAICLVWAGFEYATGSPGWAVLFGGLGGWAIWQFFVVWTDPRREDENTTTKEDDHG
ncbi:hypothetical protein [Oceanicola sp. 502str15]|uniref:hypothetical protein n=1 Tax=Oceanicola sp. 502str15 TaxID=2696061 RepID=UPI002095ACF4|nr:hypothetical protein [Oceanicola sp. 502str15]MCO6385366.1 hypothetical protein [Oceanicola sp. 502str15]